MYQGKKQKFDWGFALWWSDVAALLIAFVLPGLAGLPCSLSQVAGKTAWYASPAVAVVYLVLSLTMLRRMGLYSWRAFSKPFGNAIRLALAIGAASAALAVFRMVFGAEGTLRSIEVLGFFALNCFIVLLAARVLIRFLLMDVWRVVPVERVAFVGWSRQMDRVIGGLRREMGTFCEVVGGFSTGREGEAEQMPEAFRGAGSVSTLEDGFERMEPTIVYVLEGHLEPGQLQDIARSCGKYRVSLRVIPDALKVFTSHLGLRTINGVPVLGVLGLRFDQFHNRMLKRAFDLLGGWVGVILSAPVIGVLAWMIKRESPGPVFFHQTRVGLGGKPFQIIKLRSMKLDAEAATGAQWAVENDPRRLKIGKFMREWNLDELPQFWNVVKGEMSLVGPRPERPEFVSTFKDQVTFYNLRHSCKPGVTGWAAVHGLRGNTSLEDRITYDLFYIENWSIWLDIRVVLMTLLPPKNAY